MNQPYFTIEQANRQADDILKQDHFSSMSLAEHDLPDTYVVTPSATEAVSFGDEDAPNVVLTSTPMFTRLTDHFKLRLKAQQLALGEEYRVIGAASYDPKWFEFFKKSGSDYSEQLSSGDFSPLSARMLRVARAMKVTDEQKVFLSGYSLGGDIAIQAAHDIMFNENRGNLNLVALNASEYARSMKRGRIAVLKAFADSGNDLMTNVLSSHVASLDEAWGVDRAVTETPKMTFKEHLNGDLIKYVRDSPSTNWAMLGGFTSARGTEQLRDVMRASTLPILVANQDRSKVLPSSVLEDLDAEFTDRPNTYFLTEAGDHSADDNIRRSAGRMIYFASIAQ